MKTFEYTCRDGGGRAVRGAVEAADRAAAVRALSARGLAAVSLSERAGAPARRARRAALRWWALPCAAVALALAAALLWPRRPPAGAGQGEVAASARAAPAAPRPGRTAPGPGAGDPADAWREGEGAPAPAAHGDGATHGAAAAVGEGSVREGPGEAPEAPAPQAFGRNYREPLFRREAEQMLALYAEPGRAVPPTPFGADFERDALAALEESVVVTAEDSPEDAGRKELVAWMKEDMRRFLAGGGTVAGFFAELERRQEQEAGLLNEARRILHEIARDGGGEEALAAHRALNGELAAKGIAPLPLPRRLRAAGE
ncbi:MAG: hypothetical protein FWG50_12565 [Kiritimatiellaeota bacterium]|nr:hypothetical protein [Kiritimatiellota bacterium]